MTITVVFDLETTGTNVETDRIVEIAMLRSGPGEEPTELVAKVNPGVPIPPTATAIHGITNEAVAKEQAFDVLAEDVLTMLEGDVVLAGYNITRFDVPLLKNELKRAGRELPELPIVDVYDLYKRYNRQDLSSTVRQYLGTAHVEAHNAKADAAATRRILGVMTFAHDLPGDPKELAKLLDQPENPDWLDREGRFIKSPEGWTLLNFGKHKGAKAATVDPGFLRWMLAQDFRADAKAIAQSILEKRAKGAA